jgi:hypothetical protein
MAVTENVGMEQLKLLMTYTVFHVGVYMTLGGVMVGLLAKKTTDKGMRCWIIGALSLFIIAGICGGVVAANIPYHESFKEFEQAWIGPWGASHIFTSRWWMRIEHWAFWLGLVVFLVGFFKTGTWKGWEESKADTPTAGAARRMD